MCNARFVIDESSWEEVETLDALTVESVFDSLLDRIETARDRAEPVVRSSYLYEFAAGPTLRIHQLLFQSDILEHDLRLQISVALSKMDCWDETEDPNELDVILEGISLTSPSIAWAHQQVVERRALACLPLRSARRTGALSVEVGGHARPLHFVTNEAQHRAFFRDAIQLENADERLFADLASSAFPDLYWADGVWQGLGSFSRPFIACRDSLIEHLSVLDDHGARIFHEHQASNPQEIERRLKASGVEASDENGRTKSNSKACQNRTRNFEGQGRTFFWHTKLQPQCDRIHFLYDPKNDRIVIGLFTKHCSP